MTKISDKIKENKKSIYAMLISGSVLLFTVLIYLPCDTYFNNFNEFNFPLFDFLLPLFLKFLSGFILLGIISVFAGKSPSLRGIGGFHGL